DNIIEIRSCSAKASDITESFDDGQMTDGAFIDAFIKCMLSDEDMYNPQSVGERIFLPTSIAYALNCDYIKHYGKPPSFSPKNLVEMLCEVIQSSDLAAAKFEKSKELRSQMLYYLIFHRCNTARLPEDIEAFRPVEETAPDQA
ncbi:hypothetical protein E2562_007628, partial [Oryza meyeriana var. granulata]